MIICGDIFSPAALGDVNAAAAKRTYSACDARHIVSRQSRLPHTLPNPHHGSVPQKDVELILLRQWASYLAMPIWIMDSNGTLLFYNEPAEPILGRRFDEAGEMQLEELSSIFEATTEEGDPIPSDELPIGIALTQHRPAHRRLRIRSLDDHRWHTIEATAFPVEGRGGRHLGGVAIFWEAKAP